MPDTHAAHVRSDVVVAATFTRAPSGHTDHGVHVNWLTSVVEPPMHATHARSVDAVPSLDTEKPAAHVCFGLQLATLVCVWYVDMGQLLHCRLLVAVGATI